MATSSQDLLEAQAHVWNHIFSYINSMALRAAVELRIPDAIHKHGKPITLSQLADALCINKQKSHGLYRLMRILVHNKFFDKVSISGQEAYSLTRASRLLVSDDPSSLAPFALVQTGPVYIDPFHHMSEWFRDECPSAFFTKNGMDHWEFAAKDEKWNQRFNEAMAVDASMFFRVEDDGGCGRWHRGSGQGIGRGIFGIKMSCARPATCRCWHGSLRECKACEWRHV